jgi:predicted membrane chloride channel (bestrophin family)
MTSASSTKSEYGPFYHVPTRHGIVAGDYFKGPRDIHKHSRWPIFMRLHGSILPAMIVPLLLVAIWATTITVIDRFVHSMGIASTLLTVMGFVVSMSISFRSTTAYERYMDGRKLWTQLHMTSRNLSRLIWVHVQERHAETEDLGKADLLGKLAALNLINAFAVSLKHRLRFEPSVEYPDLAPLVGNLNTLAGMADQSVLHEREHSRLQAWGQYLGLPFAQPNPRMLLRASKENLGNTPLEVLTHLSSYVESIVQNKTLSGGHQGSVMAQLSALTEVVSGLERVVNTPLPIAYSISISQVMWTYVLTLPFQLVDPLGWVAIPGAVAAAYMILGIGQIGRELEDPFGHDVNDLPLDSYCHEIANDIDALTSMPAPKVDEWMIERGSRVLYPLSHMKYKAWETRSVEEIRTALKMKAMSRDVERERINTMIMSSNLAPVDA